MGWIFGNLPTHGIHDPLELVFMPVSAKSLALIPQQDIGQLRKGLELYYK